MQKKDTHAQICCQESIDKIGDRYDLVLIAARRARELSNGWNTTLDKKEFSAPVVALNEIEQGLIGKEYLGKDLTLSREEQLDEHFYRNEDYK